YRHVTDGGEVLLATMEILYTRQTVFEIIGIKLLFAADMEHDGKASLLRHRPDRIVRDMARRMPFRRLRWNEQRLASQIDGFARAGPGPVEVHQRDIARAKEPPVDRTEIDHHAVVRLGSGIGEVHRAGLVEAEVSQTPGREDKLTGEAQIVERARAVFPPERAMRFVVLAQQDIGVGAGAEIVAVV